MSTQHNGFPLETPGTPSLAVVAPISIDTIFNDYQSLHPSVGQKPGAVDAIEVYGTTPAKQLVPILKALRPVYPAVDGIDPRKAANAFDALSRSEVHLADGKQRIAHSLGDITVLAAILEQHAPDHMYTAFAEVMQQVVIIDAKRPAEKHRLGTAGIVRLGSLTLFALRPDEYTDDVVRITKIRHDPTQLA